MGRLAAGMMLAIAVGCGRSAAPPPPPPSVIGGDLIDPGEGAGDVIVATVAGRPVWGSCVAGHMRTRGVDRDRALADCIDLELLAAAALARGLLADPDTQGDLRTALVDGFVAEEFEDKHQHPSDLPAALIDKNLEKYSLVRPEFRLTVHARAPWGEDRKQPAPPVGSPADLAAKALAEQIYAELPGHDALFPDELYATAKRVAGTRLVDVSDRPWPAALDGGTDPPFAEAAFALRDIGSVSAPVRTSYGWDLVLLVDIYPGETVTRDQLVAELFPALRRGYFDQVWSAQMREGHVIEDHSDNLPDEESAPAAGAGSGTGP
jgi:hypothetical protein